METKQELGGAARMLLSQSMAKNTHRLDATAGAQLKSFCLLRKRAAIIRVLEPGTREFEEQDVLLCDFIGYLASKGLSYKTCRSYLEGIGRMTVMRHGVSQIGRHVRAWMCIDGLERIQGKEKVDVEETSGLSMDLLGKGWNAIGRGMSELGGCRMKAALTCGVAFMCRVSEITKTQGTDHFLLKRNVEFMYDDRKDRGKVTGMRITVRSSKNSKRPERSEIAATEARTCAVRAMKAYLDWVGSMMEDKDAVFGRIGGLGMMTSKEVKEAIRRVAKEAGETGKIEDFNTRSMRIGGTNTLIDSGMKAYVIAKHGRWKNNNTFKKVYQRPTKMTAKKVAAAMEARTE
jgi:hypothetical protein